MSDDPLQVLRIYFVIDVTTLATPTEQQWQDLMRAARDKPLAAAIRGFARSSVGLLECSKRARGTRLMQLTMCVFELDADHKAEALTILNAQATARGVSGTPMQKFAGVLQAELRESAVGLGYTTTQANKLTVTVINTPGVFTRMEAITAAQNYLANNDAIWHGAS